ncbi:MAG TPA: FtsX-like permease family protein [Clostridia bacterium]
MFLFVLRKIASNRWKVLCLLAGSILVVAMLSSIPIYTNGTLQRMLVKEMEQFQIDSGAYPGYYVLDAQLNMSGSDTRLSLMRRTEAIAQRTAADYVRLPVAASGRIMETTSVYHQTLEEAAGQKRDTQTIKTVQDFEQHATVITGRMYQPGHADGIIEAVVTERFYRDMQMVIGQVYDIYSAQLAGPSIFKVRIVGIVGMTDPSDLFWYQQEPRFGTSLLVGEQAFLNIVSAPERDRMFDRATWFVAYDYHQIRVEQIDSILGGFKRQNDAFYAFTKVSPISFPLVKILAAYPDREAKLMLTLSILIIPIVLMLVFYIFMISQLKVQSELSEISVLQSRGARRGQILRIYFLESLLLGSASMILGPPLGLLMCRVLGASNGFLEFVNRKSLPLEMGTASLLAGLGAVVLFLLTTLIPVLTNAKLSIVAQKRLRSRKARSPLWRRLFLDVLLLGIAAYGLYSMNLQLKAASASTALAEAENVDFLLYLASTVFVLGAGLLFLRIYPWLVRMVARAGSRIWSPVAYASFHQVGQSDGQASFLMLFLILSLSIGIFSADSARTINSHVEDNTRCLVGADLRLTPAWTRYDANGNIIATDDTGMEAATPGTTIVVYHEPDFGIYSKFKGIDHATRVLNKPQVNILFNAKSSNTVQLQGIDPYDFAQTVWYRNDLNLYQMNEYMNVMSRQPKAVILSRSLKAILEVNVGDSVTVSDRSISYEGVVVAFVDYWPGYTPRVIEPNGNIRENHLIITNLNYVFRYAPVEPYEVWIKRSAGATDRIVYDSIVANHAQVSEILSANQDIVQQKSDMILQGTNGMFSLGFIVSMLICAIGFLIYWILSIQGRVLQFGIFRAMGMSKRSIIGMILTEQLLISGVAIAVGLLIGKLSSSLFVPLFRLVYSSPDQPIPFRVIAYASDYAKILIIVGLILLVGFLALARLILKIRIDQAVKLGED